MAVDNSQAVYYQRSMLTTTHEVIEALGGPKQVAALLSAGGYPVKVNAVINWRARGKIPANAYFVMHDALEAIGANAVRSLWGKAKGESDGKRKPSNPHSTPPHRLGARR